MSRGGEDFTVATSKVGVLAAVCPKAVAEARERPRAKIRPKKERVFMGTSGAETEPRHGHTLW
jgi:hypothetical protein